jgi:hypothetical protein
MGNPRICDLSGLRVEVVDGPRAVVKEHDHCGASISIDYRVAIFNGDREILTTRYGMGLACVDPVKYRKAWDRGFMPSETRVNRGDEETLMHQWANSERIALPWPCYRPPCRANGHRQAGYIKFKNMPLWSAVAQKIALYQHRQKTGNFAATGRAIYEWIKPEPSDVIYSLLSDGSPFFDADTFGDWCGNYGIDNDSIKARAMFDACSETGRALVAALGRDKIETMREIFQDF